MTQKEQPVRIAPQLENWLGTSHSPEVSHTDIPIWAQALMRAFASEPSAVEQIAEQPILTQEDIFNPELEEFQELFGSFWESDQESCRAILERARWTADQLIAVMREFPGALVQGKEQYDAQDVQAAWVYLHRIVPQNGKYQYQKIDTKVMNNEQQQRNVDLRIRPHSLAAGLVPAALAELINKQLAEHTTQRIDALKLLVTGILHDFGRFVTHNITIHDRLTELVFAYAGADKTLAVESVASVHPRILDLKAEQLSHAQLQVFLLWLGDALTKADPEAEPFATYDNRPHLRTVANGAYHILTSLRNNYKGDSSLGVGDAEDDYFVTLAQLVSHDFAKWQHYSADLELLEVLPAWLESMGINLQEVMLEVEPYWAEMLTSLVKDGKLPDRLTQQPLVNVFYELLAKLE